MGSGDGSAFEAPGPGTWLRDTVRLLDEPLGNHLVLFHGRHRARVERWRRLALGGT
jgi:hypothetical protein